MPLQNILVSEAHQRMNESDRSDPVAMPVGQIVGRMNEIRPVADMSPGWSPVRTQLGDSTFGKVVVAATSLRLMYLNSVSSCVPAQKVGREDRFRRKPQYRGHLGFDGAAKEVVVSAVFRVAVIVQRTPKCTGIRCMISMYFDSISTAQAGADLR